ncbi:hypothetical protein [Natronorubrum thiooxidans]|uniref:Uncharacterized protein n=1 Tax=Natronorubrum thiooxidans TaxID=308853 RepID=A0A1N7D7W0_9EURY|nr:hypothetical protein [Natronorubrum thiooxidans]SIR71940.1 hypothetical protein SAMN05421752_10249 [Natronorubrum thiooxidans]
MPSRRWLLAGAGATLAGLDTSPWTAIRRSEGLSSGHTYPLAGLVVSQ